MPRDMSGLLISLRAIDESSSLTEVLAAAVRGAALESPRAALFVVNGTTLQEWPVAHVPHEPPQPSSPHARPPHIGVHIVPHTAGRVVSQSAAQPIPYEPVVG